MPRPTFWLCHAHVSSAHARRRPSVWLCLALVSSIYSWLSKAPVGCELYSGRAAGAAALLRDLARIR